MPDLAARCSPWCDAIDIDSTIQQVYGKQKQGAGRGGPRFVRELIGRVRRAGATGPLTLRADSGFHSKHVVAACRAHGARYSITVNQNTAVIRAIEAIPEAAWLGIDYTLGGQAEVAECPCGDEHRLVARHTRLVASRPSCSPPGASTPCSTYRPHGHGLPTGRHASTDCGHCPFEPEGPLPGWTATSQPPPERSPPPPCGRPRPDCTDAMHRLHRGQPPPRNSNLVVDHSRYFDGLGPKVENARWAL